MTLTDKVCQLLYVSTLSRSCTWEVVKELVVTSRLNNPSHGITGALLFDGERFCQLIEGPQDNVRALQGNITRDPRHTGMRILVQSDSAAARLTQRWRSGYCDTHELEALDGEHAPRGAAALDVFGALLARAELE